MGLKNTCNAAAPILKGIGYAIAMAYILAQTIYFVRQKARLERVKMSGKEFQGSGHRIQQLIITKIIRIPIIMVRIRILIQIIAANDSAGVHESAFGVLPAALHFEPVTL